MAERDAEGRGPDAVALLRAAGRVLLTLPRGLAWLPPVLWAALVWWLSSDSRSLGAGLALPEWLKSLLHDLMHPATFGFMALLAVPTLPRIPCLRGEPDGGRDGGRDRGPWIAWTRARGLVLLAAVSAYGFVDEWHQSTVPGRDASLFDVLSDATGAAAVLGVVGYLSRPDADRAGTLLRLGLGALACLAAAGLSSVFSSWNGQGLWFGP